MRAPRHVRAASRPQAPPGPVRGSF